MIQKTIKSNINGGADIEKRLSKIESDLDMIKKSIVTKKIKKHEKLIAWTSTILIIISAIFFVFSIAGYWLKTNVVNTDVWVEKTTQVIQEPSVRNDISTAIANNIFKKVDINNYVTEILPEKAKPLAGPISSSMQSFTEQKINEAMQTKAFLNVWKKINTKAHSGLINSLEKANTNSLDNNDLLYFNSDNLMLNINPIYSNVRDGLSSKGLSFVDNVTPAEVNKQIKIAHVQNMPQILFAFNLINKAALLMIIPMLLFGIGGLVIARDKRKGLMIFGISSIVLLVLNVQAVYLSQYPFIAGLNNAFQNSNSASAQAIFDIFTHDLVYLNRIAIVLMSLLIIFTFLAGPSKPSVWIRLQISKLFDSKSDSAVVKWLTENSNYIITGLIIATFLLTIFPLISSVWYLLVIFIVVGIICIALLSLKNNVKKSKKKKSKKLK